MRLEQVSSIDDIRELTCWQGPPSPIRSPGSRGTGESALSRHRTPSGRDKRVRFWTQFEFHCLAHFVASVLQDMYNGRLAGRAVIMF